MYRVIIVDDEPMIRRGLRETIEWDSLGLEVAGTAAALLVNRIADLCI